jgi:hypothetical protein
MLTLMLAVLAVAPKAPPSSSAPASIEALRRPTGQCEIVGVRPAPATTRKGRRAESEPAWSTSPTEDTKASSRANDDRRSHGPSFSATRTIDLQLGAEPRRGAGQDARLELRLYTPLGHLYQTLRATPPGRHRARAAHHGPMAWTATLPVAGTAIVNHSLYGRWRVEAHLDGSPRPCDSAERFWITP